MKKIGKLLGIAIGVVLLGVLLFMVIGWARQQYAWRQISGDLTAVPPSTTLQTDAFVLTWHNDDQPQLTIHHQQNPQKILWASLPGLSFVNGAQGEETIHEARGSFFIEDRLLITCPEQSVEQIVAVEETIVVQGQLTCGGEIEQSAYQLTFYEAEADQLAFELELEDVRLNRSYLTYASDAEEHFFGFGEQFSHFDLKGKRLPIFIMEQGVGRGAQPITAGADIQADSGGKWHTTYAGVPHYISSQLRSLFLETYEYVVFDMRQDDRVQIQLFAGQMNGRILYGDTPAELIASYTAQTGRMRPLPDWILDGAIIGMQGGTTAVRDVWTQLQQHDTPIAAFWLQDWVGQRTTSFGKQLWWNWELDETHYPGWSELVDDLNAADIQMMTYVNPFLADVSEKGDYQRNLFAEAEELGYLVRQPDGQPYLIENTSFSAGLLDLTNPDARAWMETVLQENVIGTGAQGWMADFGEALPYDALLHSGEAAATVHNQYPELWAELNRQAIDATGESDQFVFFMRAGYRESPGYSTLFWLGDQLVSWDEHDGIKTAVTGLLSSGLSGYSLNHSDIGGYTTITSPIADYHRSQELLLRWMELNAFSAIYRTHEGNIPEANVQFYSNETTLNHFSHFAKVYQAWAFYRRELVDQAAESGLPVVRPLFIHYPDDPNVYEIEYEQFLVGDSFLVAPVLDEGTDEVEVYLPAGEWVHLWSGERYGDPAEGTQERIAAPLGQPAVFYPAGSEVGAEFAANLQEMGLLE